MAGIKVPNWLDGILCGVIGANKGTIKNFVQSGITMLYESSKYKAAQTEYEFDDEAVEAAFGAIEGWKRPTE